MISRTCFNRFQVSPSPPHSLTVAPPSFVGLIVRQAVHAIFEIALATDYSAHAGWIVYNLLTAHRFE